MWLKLDEARKKVGHYFWVIKKSPSRVEISEHWGSLECLEGYNPEEKDKHYFASYREALIRANQLLWAQQIEDRKIDYIELKGSIVFPQGVRCPVIIPQGTEIYIVREQDIGTDRSPLTKATVQFMHVHDGTGRTHYNIAPVYKAFNQKHGGGYEWIEFSYNEDEDPLVRTEPLFKHGTSADPYKVFGFSTLQSAQACVMELRQERITKLMEQLSPPEPQQP